MNNFRVFLGKGFLIGVVVAYFAILVFPLAYEWVYRNQECSAEDVRWAENLRGHYVFEKVSLLFWRASCIENPPLLVMSASEGTARYSFAQAFFDQSGKTAWEFKGAHRGVKTLSYMMATQSEKTKQATPIVAYINPVYFSFAADTDDVSMQRSALSPVSFMFYLPHWKYKLRELFLTYPFLSMKSFFEEWELVSSDSLKGSVLKPLDSPPPPWGKEYSFDHHMLKSQLSKYKKGLVKDKFSFDMPPVSSFIKEIVNKIKVDQDRPLCLVFLPLNQQHLSQVRSDHKNIVEELDSAIRESIPEDSYVNLMDLSLEPYLFKDTMHFTDFGISEIVKRTLNSRCYQQRLQGYGNKPS